MIRAHLMVSSCWHSTSEVFHNIMQPDGWTGLFKGNVINVIRVAPGKAIEEFCNFSKHLTSRFIQKRLIFSVQSRFISVSSVLVPTNQQIAHLILEQKTASQALQTFKWASEISNFIHTPSTYRALIHKLCTFRQFETVEQLLEEMPKSIGSGPDDDIFITMVRGYGRARMIREVTRVLDLLPKFGKAPSLKLLNSILDVLTKEDIDIAREFYRKKIMGSGLKGDDYTYGILMKGFCLTNRIGDGFKLLQVMKTRGVKINIVVYNTLIYALCKNGKVGRARSLMSEMEDYSDVTFNILISAYCNENNLVPALVLMEKCFGNGFLPDVVSVTKVVKVLCNSGRVLEAAEVLERVEGKGGALDVLAHNTLIEGFVRAGKVRAGLGFLKQMEMKGCLPNTDTYNILIAGFCESGMLDSALDMFHEMKRAGVKWDFSTFETLIHGLCSNGRTREGLRIFELIEEGKGSFLGRINPYNSILYGLYRENLITEALEFLKNMRNLFPTAVDMSSRILRLCHDGHTVEAKKVFEEMTAAGRCPSALIHASLIQGFCEKGCIKEAVELVNQMIGLGYFPIASTFNGLINCLCEQRKTTRAMRLVEDLKMRGFLPDSESYSLLINALCSEGEPQKALMLFLEMAGRGFTPDYNSWNVIIPAVSEFRDHKLLQQLTEI